MSCVNFNTTMSEGSGDVCDTGAFGNGCSQLKNIISEKIVIVISATHLRFHIATDCRERLADDLSEKCGEFHVFEQQRWNFEYFLVFSDEFLSRCQFASISISSVGKNLPRSAGVCLSHMQ